MHYIHYMNTNFGLKIALNSIFKTYKHYIHYTSYSLTTKAAVFGVLQNIWSGYISGPADYVEQKWSPPDHICCHKWSGQNINGPGEQTINSAHSKGQQALAIGINSIL